MAVVIFLFALQHNQCFGQKTKNVKTNSFRAPKLVKIDGKSLEWGENNQAYNSNVELFYTVANDDSFIYFIFQAKNPDIIKKVVRGGIQLSINLKEKTLATNCKAIWYPLLSIKNENALSSVLNEIDTRNNTSKSAAHQADSLTEIYNKLLTSYSNEIKISTRYSIPDSSISIYNNLQILASGNLAAKKILTYEFKVPLSFLDISYKNGDKFYYNIKLNGRPAVSSPRPKNDYVVSARTVSMESVSNLYMTTDFWGEYTLQ